MQFGRMRNKHKILVFGVFATIIFVLILLYVVIEVFHESTEKKVYGVPVIEQIEEIYEDDLKSFTSESIKEFDGNNLNLPVYIAYEGYVYDVSSGREEFYNLDKQYHYLTGRDSTEDLNIAGGLIIKNKYKIIGKYIK